MSAIEPAPALELRPAGQELREELVALSAAALTSNPSLRWCFSAERPGFEARLRGYVLAAHDWHATLGEPRVGAFQGGELVGAIYAMRPEAPVRPESLGRFFAQLRSASGRPAAVRFGELMTVMDDGPARGNEHVLSQIAVAQSSRRQGVGTRLVEWLVRDCEEHPSSAGIVLETSGADNVSFYQRLGFATVATRPFHSIEQHCMFRPIGRPDAVPRGG